jgi:hypothetical protein
MNNWDKIVNTPPVLTTWHALIANELLAQGESWADVEAHTLKENELHQVLMPTTTGNPK